MTEEHLISLKDFCVYHELEFSFIHTLGEMGLISIISSQQTSFIRNEELPKLEQILLFHRELEINLEGVEVIMRLLKKVNTIQEEMNILRNKLGFYERG
ncbi:hypothetical protein GCM10022393_10970 [Aquimarina addita]|uniref:MerR family transcriptional regulator n=1 Tax=Aquimarina addita TaxID=870485 RepID=A0ABP7XDE2_9FLAO